jgi:hypothetical protein
VAASLLTAAPPEEKVRDFTWHRKTYDSETAKLRGLPPWLDYRYLSALLLVFLALILFCCSGNLDMRLPVYTARRLNLT